MSQYPLTAINLINLSTLDSQGFLLMDFAVLQIINWFFCDIWSYILYFVLWHKSFLSPVFCLKFGSFVQGM